PRYGLIVQSKGMRPLDSRFNTERDCRAKYSVSARARTWGLSAAIRAMPTRPALPPLGDNPAKEAGEIEISAVAIGTLSLARASFPDKGTFAFYSPIVKRNFVG